MRLWTKLKARTLATKWVVILAGACVISASAAHAAPALSGQININTAQVDELALLPGIGAKKAEAIVVARQEKPFATADDLLEIKGIGPKMLEALRPYVKVDGDSDLHAMASDSAQASAASVQP